MIDDFLARLDKVKQKKTGQWVACCPAHDDKSPSLSIGEGDGGRILLKCWSGCSALEIINAVGMSWDDLFPDDRKHSKSLFSHMTTKPVLDDYIVELFESDVKAKKAISSSDKKRYRDAKIKGGKSFGYVNDVVDEAMKDWGL